MLGKVNDGDWSVLVMDPGSTKLMSAVCRVSEILNFGVACALPPPRTLSPKPYPMPPIASSLCASLFLNSCPAPVFWPPFSVKESPPEGSLVRSLWHFSTLAVPPRV